MAQPTHLGNRSPNCPRGPGRAVRRSRLGHARHAPVPIAVPRRCAPRAIVVPKVGERRKVSSPSLNTTDLRGGRSWAVGLWWWSAGPDRPGGRHQDDRLVGWSGRLRPAAMGGALDAEVAHLALDDPRVGAQPTLGDQVPQKLSYRGRDGPGQPPRGKSPPAA